MKNRIFEIILLNDPSTFQRNLLSPKIQSTTYTTFLYQFDIESEGDVKEKEYNVFYHSKDETLPLVLKRIIHFYEMNFELIPTDIFVLSEQNDSFTCELEKWEIALSSNPIVLAFNKEGYYKDGPTIFNYSHFLRKREFFEWITTECKKINSVEIDLIKAKTNKTIHSEQNSRIYDCFVFNNEFEILSLRLKLLNDKVDKFILVESKQTHSGIPKPAFFEQNKELFDEYSDKIINIVIDEFPSKMIYSPSEIDVPENLHIHWFRENFQRNEILKGLYKLGLNKNDVILISDLDEIPDPNKLDDFIEMIPEDDYCFQLQKWCIWDFDRFYNGLWPGTAGVRWETLLKSTPQEIRKNRYSENKQHTKEPFGWHCSWFGGTDAVMDKLRSFAHQELREMSREDVETKMTMNLDIHGHQLIYDKEGYRPLI